MNFIEEINAFERWLETHHLPASSQLLWYKLFMLNNRAGWVEWLQVDNRRLMAMIQAGSEHTFIRARDKLIEAGLLSFKKGKKGYPNRYCLHSFCVSTAKNAGEMAVETTVYPAVQTSVETSDIYKLKQTVEETPADNLPEPPPDDGGDGPADTGGKGRKKRCPAAPTHYADDSAEMKLAQLLARRMLKNNPQCKKTPSTATDWQRWCKNINNLLRIDGYSPKEVQEMIIFSQWHRFWKKNILSPRNLREKWDRLVLEKQEAEEKADGDSNTG